ncbi:AGC family protein kinase [Tritrichomonas foetus]|uniref:AGC family protein kinase n=1 Tax=Tritrichomonas foetus TaxID=1144522 RepID=A0A1J4JV05_9EUKA|nr:AGC family protein kinase [Tritrichomonas foetus]|eukprot:OHT02835.1 AGC family protein kinase [Tritrichomonas foetus]
MYFDPHETSQEKPKDSTKDHDISHIEATLKEHRLIYLRPIGRGGFASVHVVFSEKYSQEFVVKVSKLNCNMTEYDHAEIKTLMNLSHPNIISMFEYFNDDEYLYVVLEYCRGGSLADLLEEVPFIKPPLLYQYCYQICSAIKHCHARKIAHRDIKPANVLIDNYGRLKIADFGLSHKHENDELLNHFAGSRIYMPPEVLNREAHDPFLADIWSLGVMFYQMAAGTLPWNKHNQKEMDLSISMGMVQFYNTPIPVDFVPLLRLMITVCPKNRPTIEGVMSFSVLAEAGLKQQEPKKRAIKSSISFSPSFRTSTSIQIKQSAELIPKIFSKEKVVDSSGNRSEEKNNEDEDNEDNFDMNCINNGRLKINELKNLNYNNRSLLPSFKNERCGNGSHDQLMGKKILIPVTKSVLAFQRSPSISAFSQKKNHFKPTFF